MSRFIDLVETFDLTTLRTTPYTKKINGLLKRFPKYDKDDRFRTVLPHKSITTVDDYISLKFCTIGRFPIYGIYRRRDFGLVGVCVEGNIMYALDDCDLHAFLVPDLHVRKLCLGIQNSDLATRETPRYIKKFMCSAISTLSLGYMPEKKNEWCVAIVLLTGMTTQAVRFHKMKRHVADGLQFIGIFHPSGYDGRHQLHNRYFGMQNRWNKCSKAIRREEYPYVYSIYGDFGIYNTPSMCQYLAGEEVSLINDKNKRKGEIFKRRTNRWNGPLGNSKRKHKEHNRAQIMERFRMNQNMNEMGNKFSGRMHGYWYGPVETFKYEVASVYRFPRPDQMVSPKRFIVFANPPLGLLLYVFQVQTTLASFHLAVNNIWKDGGLLVFRRAFRPAHLAITDCMQPVSSAIAFYWCAKRHKVSDSMEDLCFNHFRNLKEKSGLVKVKWKQEFGSFVQLGCGRISGALGATCVYPLQTRMQVQHYKATYTPYFGMSDLCRRRFTSQHHQGLGDFYMTALKIWTKGLQIRKRC